jgi:hypothetical protein
MLYLQKRFPKLALSPNLSKVAKGIGKGGPAKLPSELIQLIRDYWEGHGEALKAYRDLGQHYAIVSAEARILIQEDKPPALYLVLPNNPEVKSPAQLRYDDPQIHAFPFVFEQFAHLLALCYCTTYAIIDPEEHRALVQATSIRSPVRIGAGAPDYYYPLDESKLWEQLGQLLGELRSDVTRLEIWRRD